MGDESRLAGQRLPVIFAVDGKQYVAVTTGHSLVANSTNRLTPELKPSNTANMYVFALPLGWARSLECEGMRFLHDVCARGGHPVRRRPRGTDARQTGRTAGQRWPNLLRQLAAAPSKAGDLECDANDAVQPGRCGTSCTCWSRPMPRDLRCRHHRRDRCRDERNRPQTDDEWDELEHSATALAKSVNLIKMVGRPMAQPLK